MKKVVGFGEIMGRLTPPEFLRLRQAHTLDITYAGAEASVMASVCNFGGRGPLMTALPPPASSTRSRAISTSAPEPRWKR